MYDKTSNEFEIFELFSNDEKRQHCVYYYELREAIQLHEAQQNFLKFNLSEKSKETR